MENRYIAHWFLGCGNYDSMKTDDVKNIVVFVASRVKKNIGTVCVADLLSRSKEPWGVKYQENEKKYINSRLPWAAQLDNLVQKHLRNV